MNPVNVIGIGQAKTDLTEIHLALIRECDLLVGGQRQVDMFAEFAKESLVVKGDLTAVIRRIQSDMKTKRIVVLASGDPLFHGIGATLTKNIDPAYLVIHPNITSVAAAFAAICQPWHDATIVSLHSRHIKPFNFPSLATESKVAFLTGPDKDPAFIVNKLIEHELFGFSICVLECLGDPKKEKISWFTDYKQVSGRQFSHPNIVILMRPATTKPDVSHETFPGMPDAYFRHSKGLITKSEIRSLSLSKLKLVKKDHVLWDIGSGSGSVGIEAAIQIPWGIVYAVEKNKNRIPDIVHNIANFNQSNVKVANLDFPNGHTDLKTPDRVFIGGGGKGLEKIIDCCCRRIKTNGVMVINTVILDSMHMAMQTLSRHGFLPQTIQVQISRSKSMPFGTRMEALNPVWIIFGTKPQTYEAKP